MSRDLPVMFLHISEDWDPRLLIQSTRSFTPCAMQSAQVQNASSTTGGRSRPITSNCKKQSAVFQYKSTIFQGQFSILSKFKKKMAFILQYEVSADKSRQQLAPLLNACIRATRA